jgi:hypothetical protein
MLGKGEMDKNFEFRNANCGKRNANDTMTEWEITLKDFLTISKLFM